MTSSPFILGTRGSALALAQTTLAGKAIEAAFPGVEVFVRTYTTSGDARPDIAAAKATPAGAKGLFTRELEDALLRGEIHVAVHSCKDMPWAMPEGLLLAAVLERAETGDVLITKNAPDLQRLLPGAVIGTSSVRRTRQLLWQRPDLAVAPVRGNVQTRLRKLRNDVAMEGIILARAGLERLGFEPASGRLETEDAGVFHTSLPDFYPAIGQGAIALQIREADATAFRIAHAVNHEITWQAIRAERELLRLLDGDCNLPVGVRTRHEEQVEYVGSLLEMQVILFGSEGEPPQLVESRGPAEAPEAVAAGAYDQLSYG